MELELIAGMALALMMGGCTASPAINMAEGTFYGAAMGAGAGALMTIPCFGCGAPAGAIAGAMMGSAVGLASTGAQPLPPAYYPVFPYP